MTRYVVLLRAVNVGGRKLEMKPLREAMHAAGFADCETYIASGNLVLSSPADSPEVEAAVEHLIATQFGLSTVAIARSAARFARIVAANPFPDAIDKMLHLCPTKRPPDPGAPARLAERALGGERIAIAGGEIWIDFGAGGVGTSKLLPALLDRAAGSTLTARNWNTVRKLQAMLEG